jgi:hypothetical protein
MENQLKPTTGKFGRGITWNPRVEKWRVRILLDGKRIHLGEFDSIQEAEAVYQKAKIEKNNSALSFLRD